MKVSIKKYIYTLILFLSGINFALKAEECGAVCEKVCNTKCSTSKNFWYPRSFSSYQYHDLFQMKHTYPSKKRYGKLNLSFLTEYMQNIEGKCNSCKNLGALPFWSGTNQLTIGNNDGRADLDAYQLGMGNVITDENGIGGVIQLNPLVQFAGTDMMMYWTEKVTERGMYFRLHAPVGAVMISPRLTEVVPAIPNDEVNFTQVSQGGTEFEYDFLDYPTPDRRYNSISQAFYGGEFSTGQLDGSLGKRVKLFYGRIAPARQTVIRLADIAATVGYNVYADEKGWAGLGFKVSFPTGNVPQALYMLEPIFGRAGLWGIGGEITGSYQLWHNEATNRRLTISLQSEIEHLIHGRAPNYRSFDLKLNGKGSKYLLVQNYKANYANLSPDPSINTPANPNTEVFIPTYIDSAINITTIPVFSNFAVEGAVAVMLDFACDNWNVALGGEFWGRSGEKLCIDMASCVDRGYQNLNDFAVLGRQLSSYYVPGNNPPGFDDIYTYLCEPEAQIGHSQPAAILSGSYPGVGYPAELPEGIKDARFSENRIPSELNEALDIAGAAVSSAFTGKIFAHAGYNWKDVFYSPSLAVVVGAEFTNNTNNVVQLWSVGIQGSLNF